MGSKEPSVRVTLVSATSFLDVTFATVRSFASETLIKGQTLPVVEVLPANVTFKQGWVTAVDPESVTVNGEQIKYDYLVLATGSRYEGYMSSVKGEAVSTTVNGRLLQLKKHKTDVKQASKIAVIGGGITATEMMGEILEVFPDKKLDWFISGKALLSGLDDAGISKTAEKHFEKYSNLTIHRGTRMLPDDPVMSEFDLVMPVVGMTPNTGFLQGSFLHTALDNRGYINTRKGAKGFPTAIVEGVAKENVMALGDLISPTVQSGYTADNGAKVFAGNLLSHIKTGSWSNAKEFDVVPPMCAISLGPKNGAGLTKGHMHLPTFVIKMMKSKDLFVVETNKNFGRKITL